MTSLSIPSGKKSEDLPYLYWIPKLHKTPYKESNIAAASFVNGFFYAGFYGMRKGGIES
jgi:hypothetical protein